MSLRVQRADVALSVAWEDISGKPAIPASGTTVVEKTTVVREVPAPPAPVPTPGRLYVVTWEPGLIQPLETVSVDVTFYSIWPGQQIALGTPADLPFFAQVSATIPTDQTIRISITNLGLGAENLASADWKLRVFS